MSTLLPKRRIVRREAHKLALGAGAFAGFAPAIFSTFDGTTPVVHAEGASPVLDAVTGSDRFGTNEAFRARKFSAMSGAGWTRWTVQWFNMQQQAPKVSPSGAVTDSGMNEHYFRDEKGQSILEQQVKDGVQIAAMVLGTPEWAATTAGLKTGTSIPAGLDQDVKSPANTFGYFMYNLAKMTAGLISVFEIWNEVEIPTSGSNAVYNTFAGSATDYYRLLGVAKAAVDAAGTGQKICTSPYSYFKDKDGGKSSKVFANQQQDYYGALPWMDEFLSNVQSSGVNFDVFALNLYRNPHDLWDRFRGTGSPAAGGDAAKMFDTVSQLQPVDAVGFRQRLNSAGASGVPIWLTEINAMPYDDSVPGWDPSSHDDGFRITMDQQASYVIQAYALALSAGYERVFFQALQDDKYPVPDELWGLVRFNDDRDNGDTSRARPAFTAYQVAAKYLGDFDFAQLFVRQRPDAGIKPGNPWGYTLYASRYIWAVQAAVFQKGDRRVTVLWDSSGSAQSVSLNLAGSSVKIVSKDGKEDASPPVSGSKLTIALDPATRHFDLFGGDPPGYFYVGGNPVLVVETGVGSMPGGPNADGFVTAF